MWLEVDIYYIQHSTTSHICCIHVWFWSIHLLYSTYYNITHLLYTYVTLKKTSTIFNILQHHPFAVYMCDFEVDIYYIQHSTTSHICCIHMCDFEVDLYFIQHITTSHICSIHLWLWSIHLLYSTYLLYTCVKRSHVCCIHVWFWSRHRLYSTYYKITRLLYTCVTLKKTSTIFNIVQPSHICCIHVRLWCRHLL